jgi:hypothetical protein
MNFLAFITICAGWYLMYQWFRDNTCALNNHEFKLKGTSYICKKCGLIKKAIKK